MRNSVGFPALERGSSGLQQGKDNSKFGGGRAKWSLIQPQPGTSQEKTHRCGRPPKLHNFTEELPQRFVVVRLKRQK